MTAEPPGGLGGRPLRGGVAAATGWLGVAFHHTPWALVDQGLWRAASPLTYANATGALLAAGLLLALARQSIRPSPALAVASCVLTTGLAATMSRGGLIAL